MVTRTPRAGTTLCCVTIGHRDYVMSLDKGLKLVALLQDAIECDRNYRADTYYRSPSQPSVSMEVLKAGQFFNTSRPVEEEDE